MCGEFTLVNVVGTLSHHRIFSAFSSLFHVYLNFLNACSFSFSPISMTSSLESESTSSILFMSSSILPGIKRHFSVMLPLTISGIPPILGAIGAIPIA